MTKSRGFTLIELVAVMAILGVLAAIVLPRYIALQTQARVAKLNAAFGGVKSATALTHGACIGTVLPAPCGMGAFSLNMEGLGVTLLNQYPTADAAGIVAAAGLTLTAAEGFDSTGGGAHAADVITIRVVGNDPANCSFRYTASAGANLAPIFDAPLTTGC